MSADNPIDDRPTTESASVAPDETATSADDENPNDSAVLPLGDRFAKSELVIGLVGPVGSKLADVVSILERRLKVIGYEVLEIHISRDIIPALVDVPTIPAGDEYVRINTMMDAGDEARKTAQDNSILALGAASWISTGRAIDDHGNPMPRVNHAYIINSPKHPDEVTRLREIYPQGFYLIGVHEDESRRHQSLTDEMRIDEANAQKLMARDQNEHLPYGQRVAGTFHLSDFFVRLDGQEDQLRNSLWRILDILFGDPYRTPEFDEFAMFLAFAASLRSADLSRQVGAVVAKNKEIIATGANDSPRAGGGLYWPEYNEVTYKIEDEAGGRDYARGVDSNKIEQQKIIDQILSEARERGLATENWESVLADSRIRELTEFGRVVHAEMEAVLSCARNSISARDATLYCTTFPCHNCAKHIIAAGIKRVVFIEPYEKSKAAEFHTDSIRVGLQETEGASPDKRIVRFEPFVGVGPRRFFDLFSMQLGSGTPLERKNNEGRVLEWRPEGARPRLRMLPYTYMDMELVARTNFNLALKSKESNPNE